MNEEKTYEWYITKGPDAMPLKETLAALSFRDSDPAAARRVEARIERSRREAAEKDDLLHAWRRDGGDEKDFEAAHRELSTKQRTERLATMDREAREASRRAILEGF